MTISDIPRNGGTWLTRRGREIAARLGIGENLTIDSIWVGSGNILEHPEIDPLEITELLEPKATATRTEPVQTGSQVDFTIEYRNSMQPTQAAFSLNEFGGFFDGELVFVGTLGYFPHPVNAFDATQDAISDPPFQMPISIVLADGIGIAFNFPADASVTEQRVLELIKEHSANMGVVPISGGGTGAITKEAAARNIFTDRFHAGDFGGGMSLMVSAGNFRDAGHMSLGAVMQTARDEGMLASPVQVINNLTSVSTTAALSANQGRILRENGGVMSGTWSPVIIAPNGILASVALTLSSVSNWIARQGTVTATFLISFTRTNSPSPLVTEGIRIEGLPFPVYGTPPNGMAGGIIFDVIGGLTGTEVPLAISVGNSNMIMIRNAISPFLQANDLVGTSITAQSTFRVTLSYRIA